MMRRSLATLPLALVAATAACDTDRKAAPADSAIAVVATVPVPVAVAPVVTPSTGVRTMLSPNSATREQLLAIPGMTAAAADAILAGRPYADMTVVDKALAPHLDAAARARVYAILWKPLFLNTAKKEEILLIPGVGPRMLHEFEEYRPYKSIADFDREIGKYVDKTELARLRGYVRVN